MTAREHLQKILENVRRYEKTHREAASTYSTRGDALDMLVSVGTDEQCLRALNSIVRDAPNALVN